MFYLNQFPLHLNLHLLLHLINMRFQLDNFLLNFILPAKLTYKVFPLIFYHGKYFILKLFNFFNHFLFSFIVLLSPLIDQIFHVIFVVW